MKTVDKAMLLLRQFSLENLEIGLNDLSRLTGEDKAVTRRLLISLMKHGCIEQDADTRKYRLGHGFLSLARLRETTVPLVRATQIAAKWLCTKSGETVHVGLPGSDGMTTATYALPAEGNVINLKPADSYPFHASSSGLAFLAYCTGETRNRLLSPKLDRLTPFTLIEREQLDTFFVETLERGYSFSRNTVEEGVCSIAMPFFTDDAEPMGTIAIAVPDHNMTDALQKRLVGWLRSAVEMLEIALIGSPSNKRNFRAPSGPDRGAIIAPAERKTNKTQSFLSVTAQTLAPS